MAHDQNDNQKFATQWEKVFWWIAMGMLLWGLIMGIAYGLWALFLAWGDL